jgi:hypothetical protein
MRNIMKILIGQWALMDPKPRPITLRPSEVFWDLMVMGLALFLQECCCGP